MSLAPFDVSADGCFTEKEFGNDFEYVELDSKDTWDVWLMKQGCTHKIFVGCNAEMRGCKLLKTVAYILADEDENGNVWEKWYIKNNKNYK